MTQDQRTPVDASDSAEADVARRSVLRGALALGAVGLGGALGGCGSKSSDTATSGSSTTGGSSGTSTGGSAAGAGATSAPSASSTPTPAASSTGSTSSGSAGTLGPASAIESGGGKVFTSQKIVVTQPSMGTFKAFSAVCTHQSCTVGDVSNGTINCYCHGSKFSITDGSVQQGPATKALAAKTVTVTDGNLSVS